MTYRVTNIETNEERQIKRLIDVVRLINASSSANIINNIKNKGYYQKDNWVVTLEGTNIDIDEIIKEESKYQVRNIETNEVRQMKRLADVARFLNVKYPSIITNVINIKGYYCKSNFPWIVTIEGTNIDEINKNRRTLEGSARDMFSHKEYLEFIGIINKRKKNLRWKLNEAFLYEEREETKNEKKEWEEHCKKCCVLSPDGKVWIPKTMIAEFPDLINFTLPKSMF